MLKISHYTDTSIIKRKHSSSSFSSSSRRGFKSYVDTPSRMRSLCKDVDSIQSITSDKLKRSRSNSSSRRTPSSSRCARESDIVYKKSHKNNHKEKTRADITKAAIERNQDEEKNQSADDKLYKNANESHIRRAMDCLSRSRTNQTLESPRPRNDEVVHSSRNRLKSISPSRSRSSSIAKHPRPTKEKSETLEDATSTNKPSHRLNDAKLIKIMQANNVYITCGCCKQSRPYATKQGHFYLTIGRSSDPPLLYDDMASAPCQRDKEKKIGSNLSQGDNLDDVHQRESTPIRRCCSKGSFHSKTSSKGNLSSKRRVKSKKLPIARTPPRSPVSRSSHRSSAGISPPFRTVSQAALAASNYYDCFSNCTRRRFAEDKETLKTAQSPSSGKPSNTTSFETTFRIRDHQDEIPHNLTIQAEIQGKKLISLIMNGKRCRI
ncbi:hypothetical protein DICVIV_08910 [Dictyocaulus viviparus]|uniref:Uncharacterized protein n=1 Tax=Dictyocaulus viviparus TaxID=29172 RepID=A0A0D8XKH9_DICVI|nr:hypothetical protein DICVIV_08910 [Dictyocaulus viviparus]